MDESEDNIGAEEIKSENGLKTKLKKRSLVERELETSLTARVTSPITNAETSNTSRYGRARRLKNDTEPLTFDKTVIKVERSLTPEKTPVKVQSPVYKMHASNSPIRAESPKGTPNKVIKVESDLENQIETIYHENISLSRFGSEEKKNTPNKVPKVYVRKDLIQKREEEETITLIKNLFSPVKSAKKSNSHINNILDRSSEKYGLNSSKSPNGYASVVKTLDFDSKKKKKDNGNAKLLSKSELFEMEAKCEYQVGDLAWSRMGTYPFWPCIVTREPSSGMFVKKKLFGRIERDIIHVTFFGDNGRRGWIVDSMLRKFHGQLEFEATREQFTPADKKKDPRLYAAFFISEKKLPQWNVSVEEAEILLREPKRLRIDILNDMLQKSRVSKITPRQNKSGKITRTASDVSLSESLYDTLFSEDDGKDDTDRSRNKSLDVSEVVTACLDNIAAKSGITKIQRQSHMDRWLQKAKSKTPEKNQSKLQIVPQKVEKETKVSSAKKKKKSLQLKKRPLTQKTYSFRRSANESPQMMPHSLDHAYNNDFAPSLNSTLNTENASDDDIMNIDEMQSGIGVIAKVESLSELSANESLKYDDDEVEEENLSQSIITEKPDSLSESKSLLENEPFKNTEISDVIKDTELKSIESKSSTESSTTSALSSQENVSKDPANSSKNTTSNIDSLEMDISTSDEIENKDIEISLNNNKSSNSNKMDTLITEEKESKIKNKMLDSDIMETSSVEDKSFSSGNKVLDSSKIDTVPISDDKENDQIASKNSSKVITEPKCKAKSSIFTKDVNGDINDYNVSEKSSSDSNTISESTQSFVNGNQEHNISDFFKPLSTHTTRKKYSDPEFIKYLELRQDDIIDQHPELIQEEIVEYLYKTWLYEDGSKSELKKTNDLEHSNLVKDLNKPNCKKKQTRKSRQKKINKPLETEEYVEEKLNYIAASEPSKKLLNNSYEVNIEISRSTDADPKHDIDIIPNVETKSDEIIDELKSSSNHINEITLDCYENKEGIAEIIFDKSVNNSPQANQFQDLPSVSCSENVNKNMNSYIIYKKDDDVSETELPDEHIESAALSKNHIEEKSNIAVNDQIIVNDDMNVSCSEKELYEPEITPKTKLAGKENLYFSTCKPIKVGVSEQTEVEIIANKEQDMDKVEAKTLTNYNTEMISAVDLDDEMSDDSIDISYAISPLSVKGDDDDKITCEDLIKAQEEIKKNMQKIEADQQPIVNGILYNSDYKNTKTKYIPNSDFINEAGNKKDIMSKEIEKVVKDKINSDNTIPSKEIIDKEEATNVTKNNSTHVSKFIEDLECDDNSSVHSEDSEPLSVTKTKLKQKERVNKYAEPKFVQFLEMRQDDIIDEHPELKPDEIVEYLYKTWLYEENIKSDIRKTDEDQQSNLVKGLGEPKPEAKKRKTRESKEKKKDTKEVTTSKDNSDVETASVKSDESLSLKRWLRPKRYTSKLYADFDSSRDSSPAVTDEINSETISLHSLDSDDSRAHKSTPRCNKGNKINDKSTINTLIKEEQQTSDLPNKHVDSNKSNSTTKLVNGIKDVDMNIVKEEFDPETVSLNSEGSEVSVSKRRARSKNDMTVNDPEFIKYLELRQDALIDENPQLSQDEIVAYLFKTWLYEESGKSDIKKSAEMEHSNLVKGLNQNQDIAMPRKVRKKIKIEDYFDEDTMKAKPKRKTVQPYYNEDYSDIEDEIAMFEIMKNTPKVELNKMEFLDRMIKEKHKESTVTAKATEAKQKETEEVIEIEDEIDEVELYFKELTQPKPNLFKGLIREKVCEICEKVGSLIKCKSCNGMFHLDCVKRELKVVETKVTAPSKGRKKKKKKPGRKAKNLEDSGSLSDEKSQDVSAENMSIEEILEPVSRTVDAENFEAQLEEKMKELLESTNKEIHYDSYSSDDGIDWEGTVAGKCEIVDVKLKPKSQSLDYSDFKCNNCQKYDTPICFVCKSAVSKTGADYRQRCQVAHCHKYYHLECLDHWPQTQFSSGESRNKKNEVVETHMCPRHVCHTCVSDDPRGCKTRFSGDKLARCVRCPATYHSFTKCLPAGTQILTGSHIICPRHYEHRPGKVPCHVNTGWCFICALGGTLICCEYCPTSFHAECLNISPPEGNYMCEDCETGRLPLYGEMVWVKLGHYRWWPGIVLHPCEIPDNIMAVKHSPGEFVVRFFGQYDHYWVNRGRVFPFQEGDSGKISSQKSKIDAAFTTAMEHAQRACQILKNAQENEAESLDIASSLLPPHYVKLRVNKPCGSLVNRRIDAEESSLTQCECDPAEQDPCGPYSQCLNRMLLTECGPICRAGDRCNNRAFEKRQYPKLVAYRTAHRGWGLKTLESIRAGQFVIEYVGELIDEEEFKRRMARKHEIRDENFYFLTLDKERMIDAGPKGNLARFMNHCCEPNCETQKWTVLGDVRVGLFAIHDIPAMSEVTFNYNLECAGIDKKRCMCGAKRCAGYIGAKPKQDESQSKKSKVPAKRTYKKRKNTEESPSTKSKLKRPVGRPAKPKELTEIEKDLLIIKNATNGLSSDSDNSRLSSLEGDRNAKALKRKRVSFSTEEVVIFNGTPPSVKKMKVDEEKCSEAD